MRVQRKTMVPPGRARRGSALTLRSRRVVISGVVVALVLPLAPAVVHGVEPPPELRHVCVDRQENIDQADAPGDCTTREVALTLPQDRPLHVCADGQGNLRRVSSPGGCGRGETGFTVPDSGPRFLCSENIRGGTRLSRGDLRLVVDASECTRSETAFVTPASPQAVPDHYTIDEDTVLTVPARGVLDNDRDLTGEPLRSSLVATTDKGTLSFAADGSFAYDPRGAFEHLDHGQSGEAVFRYLADDGALQSAPATVTVVVTGRNDRPVARADRYGGTEGDVYGTTEDEVLDTVAGVNGVLDNDEDAEGHPLTAGLVTAPEQGELTLDPDGSFSFDPKGRFEDLDDDETRSVQFEYVARDGTAQSATGTATIVVGGVNDAPVGGKDVFSTDENTQLRMPLAELLANDHDPDDPLMVAAVLTAIRGECSLSEGDADAIVFDPHPAFDGLAHGETTVATCTYVLDDGDSTTQVDVDITVVGLETPEATDRGATTDEDRAVDLDLTAGDDVRGGVLHLVETTSPGGARIATTDTAGVVAYDPTGAFDRLPVGAREVDTFTYYFENDEGRSRTATVAVTVEGRNDLPTAVPDNYSLGVDQAASWDASGGVLANDTDPDIDQVTLAGEDLMTRLVAPPPKGRLSLESDGGFRFDPAGEFPDDGETVSFSYRATDGKGESNTAEVRLNVGSNVPPRIDGPFEFRILTDHPSGQQVGTVAASDPDATAGDPPLEFAFVGTDPGPFSVGATSGIITVTGAPDEGAHQLTLRVRDGDGGTSQALLTVRVLPPLAPEELSFTAVGNTELVAGEGTAVPEAPVAARTSATLPHDGASVAVVQELGVPTGAGGRVDIHPDGTFRYVPPLGFEGEDGFSYTLCRDGDPLDGCAGGETAQGTAEISIGDVVWYVDSSAPVPAAGTEGSSLAPHRSFSELSEAGLDEAGDVIFAFGARRSPYQENVVLDPEQVLVGEGGGLVLDGYVLDAGRPDVAVADVPQLAPAAGPALTVTRDNTVRGVAVSSGGQGIVAGAEGPAELGELTIVSPSVVAEGGPGLVLDAASGTANVAIEALEGRGPAAVELRNLAGSVNVGTAVVGGAGAGDGLVIGDNAATVSFGTVLARALTPGGTALPGAVLRVDGNAGTVVVGDVRSAVATTSTGTVNDKVTAGITVEANESNVTVHRVSLPAVTGTGLRVAGNAGTITIGGGALGVEGGDRSGAFVDVGPAVHEGSPAVTGALTLGADVSVGPGGGASTPTSPAVRVSGLSDTATVGVSGLVTAQGAGIRLEGNGFATAVAFTGGLDLDAGDAVAFHATSSGVLEVLGSGTNRLRTEGAAALLLDAVATGGRGIRFDDVTAVAPVLEVGSDERTGAGIVLGSVRPPAGGTGRVNIVAGRIQDATTSAVRLAGSEHVTVGTLAIAGSARHGLQLSDNEDVVVNGTTVDDAGGHGISSTSDRGLLLDGASVRSSGRSGVHVDDVDGAVTLRNSLVQQSFETQVRIVDAVPPADAGSGAGDTVDTVTVEGTSISGSPAETPNLVVEAREAANLRLRVGGATPSASVGGLTGVRATASHGGRLDVDVARLHVSGSDGPGIALAAEGSRSLAGEAVPSAVDFALHDLDPAAGGGIQGAGTGIALSTDGVGTLSGSLARVQVGATDGPGISATRVSGLTLDEVQVLGARESGLLLAHSDAVTLRRVEVRGAPVSHGVELRNVDGFAMADSRIDLRADLPAEETPPSDHTAPCRSATHPAPNPVPDAPLYAGFFARNVGSVDLTDTTVRGATLHQVVVVNGASFPDGEITSVQSRVPPPPAGTPELSTGTLTASGLTLLDTPAGRNALFAAAGKGASLTAELPGALAGARPTTTDAPLLLCAVDVGSTTVGGGPAITAVGGGDVVVLKASGELRPFPMPPDPAVVTYTLVGMSIQFRPDDPSVTGGRAVATIAELGGIVDGRVEDVVITDPPGDGFELTGVDGVRVDGITVENAAGRGIVVSGSNNVTLLDAHVVRSADASVVVEDSTDVSLTGGSVTEPGAAGIVLSESDRIALTGVDVVRPQGHGIEARDVSDLRVHDASIDYTPDPAAEPGSVTDPVAPFSGLFARHVGGLVELRDVRSTAAPSDQVVVVNGSSFPGVGDDPGSGAPGDPDGTHDDAMVRLEQITTAGTVAGARALLAGAGPGGRLAVELAGTAVTRVDAPLHLESAGGRLDVAGGHQVRRVRAGDALVLVEAIDVALAGLHVDFEGASPAERGAGLVVLRPDRVTIDDSTVAGAGAGAVRIVGGRQVAVSRAVLATVGGPGIEVVAVTPGLCLDLVGNDASAAATFGFDLTGVALRDLGTEDPDESVAGWLTRKGNVGDVRSGDEQAC